MGRRKLSDELMSYGYVFSLKKTVITYLLMIGLMLIVGFSFHMKAGYLIILCGFAVLMLPLFLRNYYYNKREQEAFSDVNIYMEQFMYSFLKSEKIFTTLQEVISVFEEGKMKNTIASALDALIHTYDSPNPEALALGIVEQEYSYDGLNSLHNFAIQVEKNGGEYASCMQLLIDSRRMWADRVYENLKQRKQERIRVIISIILSLGLCELVSYMSKTLEVDIASNTVVQIFTLIVLILDMLIYYFADKKLSASILSADAIDENEALQTYKRFESYKENPRRHRFAISIAKKNLSRDFEKIFPKWLMQVSLLLQCENPQVAIFKSYDDAPDLLKPELSKFISELKMNPNSVEPYNNFLGDFILPEVRSCMKMLYSLAEGNSKTAADQIKDIIRRNQVLMDKSEKLKAEDSFAGMYALFLAPQLTGGTKLVVDMVFIFIVYVAQMVG